MPLKTGRFRQKIKNLLFYQFLDFKALKPRMMILLNDRFRDFCTANWAPFGQVENIGNL